MNLQLETSSLQTDGNLTPIPITDHELLGCWKQVLQIYFSRQLNKIGIPGKIRAILDWCEENNYRVSEEQVYRMAQTPIWRLIE